MFSSDVPMPSAAAEDSEDSSEPFQLSPDRPPRSLDQQTFTIQSPEAERKTPPSGEKGTLLVYCICKDPLWDSAMIQCHRCHDYFHGSCVGISRQKASLLKHFYCPLCIDKEPGLVTEFETREAIIEQRLLEEKGDEAWQREGKKLKNKRHNRR